MPLREYFFKTASAANPLCAFTRAEPGAWVLIHLFRTSTQARAQRAMFTFHASNTAIDRFLVDEFGRRYGTYDVLSRSDGIVSVEVTNYLLPQYRGLDPVELATQLLGKDAYVGPILVEAGYFHIKIIASPSASGEKFGEMIKRISTVTSSDDFKLIHTGDYDPLRRLKPRAEALSPRQDEILRMAIELGYYDDPRKCTLETLARQFGVSKAAVHKRLVSAESKILKGYYP